MTERLALGRRYLDLVHKMREPDVWSIQRPLSADDVHNFEEFRSLILDWEEGRKDLGSSPYMDFVIGKLADMEDRLRDADASFEEVADDVAPITFASRIGYDGAESSAGMSRSSGQPMILRMNGSRYDVALDMRVRMWFENDQRAMNFAPMTRNTAVIGDGVREFFGPALSSLQVSVGSRVAFMAEYDLRSDRTTRGLLRLDEVRS